MVQRFVQDNVQGMEFALQTSPANAPRASFPQIAAKGAVPTIVQVPKMVRVTATVELVTVKKDILAKIVPRNYVLTIVMEEVSASTMVVFVSLDGPGKNVRSKLAKMIVTRTKDMVLVSEMDANVLQIGQDMNVNVLLVLLRPQNLSALAMENVSTESVSVTRCGAVKIAPKDVVLTDVQDMELVSSEKESLPVNVSLVMKEPIVPSLLKLILPKTCFVVLNVRMESASMENVYAELDNIRANIVRYIFATKIVMEEVNVL